MKLSKKDWDSILMSKDVKSRLDDLVARGVMAEVFPEVHKIVPFGDGKLHKRLWMHTKQVIVQCGDNLPLRWVALFHDVGKPDTFEAEGRHVMFYGHEILGGKLFAKAARRTGLWDGESEQRADIKYVIANSGRADYHETWTDSAVKRFVKETGRRLDLILDFTLADQTTSKKHFRDRNQRRIAHLRQRIAKMHEEEENKVRLPKGLGHAIINDIGAKGSEIGKFMDLVRHAVSSGDIENGKDIGYYMDFVKRV